MDEIETMSLEEARALLRFAGAALRRDEREMARQRERYRAAKRGAKRVVTVSAEVV